MRAEGIFRQCEDRSDGRCHWLSSFPAQMKRTKAMSGYHKFAALSPEEKEKVFRSLNDPDLMDKARPLSPAMKAAWARAKRKGGRPQVGRGATRVLISVERGLLEDADAYARQRRLTRSELFSRGV